MRTTLYLAALAVIASCSAPQKLDVKAPMSADDHQEAAVEHDRAATSEERAAVVAHTETNGPTYSCGDTVLADQATSGGERLDNGIGMPCFNTEDESDNHLRRAAHEHDEARHDRGVADRMLAAEQASCSTIGPAERDHSAFAHRRDIAQVTPIANHGKVAGAKIDFKPVRGLSADWLKASIACHEAQFAAAGKDPKLMTEDPTMVDGAQVAVGARPDGGLEVTITAKDDTAAAVILGRAQDLVTARTADAGSAVPPR